MMGVQQCEEGSNLLETRSVGDGIGFTVPIDESSVGKFWQMLMVEVPFERLDCPVVGLEICRLELVFVAGIAVGECPEDAASRWLTEDIECLV